MFTPLIKALGRGVRVTILTHDVLNATSLNATAVEELRRETRRIGGHLAVYSADVGAGVDRRNHPLLHAKLVIADETMLLLGSANLTAHALSSNLEAGTVLGRGPAAEAASIIAHLISSNLAYLVFDTTGEPRAWKI